MTIIKIGPEVVLWPGRPAEVFCWFKSTLQAVASKFYAPVFEREGFRYILIDHPSLGLIAFDEGIDFLNKGNLEVLFSPEIPYSKAKEEFPTFIGDNISITWSSTDQPSFPKG